MTHDYEKHGLKSGDVGTVVHCYKDQKGFEVEFVTAEGKTVAVLTLTNADIRPFEQSEILHVRGLEPLEAWPESGLGTAVLGRGLALADPGSNLAIDRP